MYNILVYVTNQTWLCGAHYNDPSLKKSGSFRVSVFVCNEHYQDVRVDVSVSFKTNCFVHSLD